MSTVKGRTDINAPVDKVFDYIAAPVNLLKVWPSLVEVHDAVTLPNGGHTFHFVYKMADVRFEGISEVTEVEAGRHIVSHTKGGIESTGRWDFEPHDGEPGSRSKATTRFPSRWSDNWRNPTLSA